MPKGKGKEWTYFTVLQESKNNCLLQCVYCNKQFWGSANRIRAHLGIESVAGVTKCEKVPSDIVMRLGQAEANKNSLKDVQARKRVLDETFGRDCRGSTSNSSAVSDPKQPKMPAMLQKLNADEVDRAIARMCFSTGASFRIVNNKHFKEMCAKIAAYGPSYKVPSDHPIRTTLLEKEMSLFVFNRCKRCCRRHWER